MSDGNRPTRLLALTVLADGGLDRNEVDTMMHTDLARRLGIGSVEFERILRESIDPEIVVERV